MKTYITQLTQLKLSHADALQRAAAFTDPDLSDEGIAKRRQELTAAVQGEHADKLRSLEAEMAAEVERAKQAAAREIPEAPAETSAGWALAQMLLNSGQTLNQVIASADPAVLHAVSQYGPTYLRAQALQGRQDPYAPIKVDTAGLQRSIRQRWGQVLGNAAQERIQQGQEAESVEAEFRVAAEHFAGKLNGVRTGLSDLDAAVEASMAGKAASSSLQQASA